MKVSTENEMSVLHGTVVEASRGSAGLRTILKGQATTVSALADSTGGIGDENFIVPDFK